MAVKKTASAPDPLAGWIDELGDLEIWAAPFASKLKRIETLRKAIRERYDPAPVMMPQNAAGARFLAFLGMRASVSTVNVAALVKEIGKGSAYAILTCTLKALEAFPGVAALVVTRALTGTRPLSIVPKGSA